MGKKGGSKKHAAEAETLTAEECFEEAEIALMQDDLDTARARYTQALKMEPQNGEYLSGYGAFLAETGNPEEAVQVLTKAAAAQPDTGFEKYMYLGQMLAGAEAEKAIRKGIEILRQDVTHAEAGGSMEDETEEEAAAQRAALANQLCSSLCCLAEHLLSAAAEEAAGAVSPTGSAAAAPVERVAPEVEALLAEARTLDDASPEPLQAAAVLDMARGRHEAAAKTLTESVAMWLKPPRAAGGEEGEGDGSGEEELGSQDSEEEDGDDGAELPSFEFRFEAARMLLELDCEADSAIAILAGLLEENDTVPAVYLLLAEAFVRAGDCEDAADVARDGLLACQAAARAGAPDPDVATSLEELSKEIEQLIAAGEGEEAEEGEEDMA